MARRTANKTPELAAEVLHREKLRDSPPPSVRPIQPHPRRGNRVLLCLSVALFLGWLAILAWLAIS